MGVFLWLSDLHLDPYYGQEAATGRSECLLNETRSHRPYGSVGCDAPLSLVHETLRHIQDSVTAMNYNGNNDENKHRDTDESSRRQSSQLDFILITGDFVRHGTDRLDDPIPETQAVLSTLSTTIQSQFPNVSVIPTLGNNDVTPDYYLDASTTENNTLLDMVVDGLGSFLTTEEERRSFRRGGYFARNLTTTSTSRLTILSLNTILYSVNHLPTTSQTPNMVDPMDQFAWLEDQLTWAQAAQRVVYIVGHIPPAIGSYRKSQFWRDSYLNRYFAIIQNYKDVIGQHLFGHLHSEEFRLLAPFEDNEAKISTATTTAFPLWIASSVTPVYGANPSYRLVQYDRDGGRLLDYTTVYLDLERTYGQQQRRRRRQENDDNAGESVISLTPVWEQLPSFRETYGVNDLSASSLKRIVAELSSNSALNHRRFQQLWGTFLSRQTVYSSNETTLIENCQEECRVEWLCVMQATSLDSYYDCLEATAVPPYSILYNRTLQDVVVVLVVVFAMVVAVVCGVIKTKRYCKRRHYRQAHPAMDENDGITMVHDDSSSNNNNNNNDIDRNEGRGDSNEEGGIETKETSHDGGRDHLHAGGLMT